MPQSNMLLSLLGQDLSPWMLSFELLRPLDFLMTVNYSSLWQSHVAWAKPDGKELRLHITQQYSTNMVLLSLMLGIQMSILFHLQEGFPKMFEQHSFGDLQYWTNWMAILGTCVTVLGLVTTFNLWGMVSAISDQNSHCVLRSSLGLYVTSLPPRFVVLALYMFMIWMILFIVNIVGSPTQIGIMMLVFLLLFEALITPLSAFGRLIIQTGSMGKKPILQKDLERELLPSGLLASLLLRAKSRQKQNHAVAVQYQRRLRQQNEQSDDGIIDEEDGDPSRMDQLPKVVEALPAAKITSKNKLDNQSIEKERKNEEWAFHSRFGQKKTTPKKRGHQRYESVDTLASEYPYPEASILNAATTGRTLQTLLETASIGPATASTTTSPAHTQQQVFPSTEPTQSLSGGDTKDLGVVTTDFDGSQDGSFSSLLGPDQHSSRLPVGAGTRNLPRPHRRHGRQQSSNLMAEWMHESNVRDLYGASPPAELPMEILIDAPSKRTSLLGLEALQWSSGMLWSQERDSSDQDNASGEFSQGPNATTAIATSSRDLGDGDQQQPLLDDETWLMNMRNDV